MKKIVACAWSLGILLFGALPADAQQILAPGDFSGEATPTQSYSVQSVLDELLQADVVYLGETHDRPQDHQAQLQIIQELHQLNPNIAIAMEMFQRPYQAALDEYLAGEIDAAELRQRSQYDQRWGFPWAYYAPILQFAQTNQLPVLALNVPTEVTRRVADKGWDSLLASDRQWIPPLSEIRTDDPEYRRFLLEIYNDHEGHSPSTSFDNFVLAQVLWDETMAATVAEFLTVNPDRQVIVLAGQGHVVYGYGIPNRVARRLGDGLVQRSLLLNPAEETLSAAAGAIADYFWITD